MRRPSPAINKRRRATCQWILFMTERLYHTPKTTEQNFIVCICKSEAELTNNKRRRSRYSAQTGSTARHLGDSRACFLTLGIRLRLGHCHRHLVLIYRRFYFFKYTTDYNGNILFSATTQFCPPYSSCTSHVSPQPPGLQRPITWRRHATVTVTYAIQLRGAYPKMAY